MPLTLVADCATDQLQWNPVQFKAEPMISLYWKPCSDEPEFASEINDTENPFLYSGGIYPTKLTADDLPEDYIPICSRVIWYLKGYLRTSGIEDMTYTWVKENHLFKDDYIYISYHGPLKEVTSQWGHKGIEVYDFCVCGNDIIGIVLAAEKYSGFDTSEVRAEIEKKRVWLRENEPDYYKECRLGDRDIFQQWKEKGYI